MTIKGIEPNAGFGGMFENDGRAVIEMQVIVGKAMDHTIKRGKDRCFRRGKQINAEMLAAGFAVGLELIGLITHPVFAVTPDADRRIGVCQLLPHDVGLVGRVAGIADHDIALTRKIVDDFWAGFQITFHHRVKIIGMIDNPLAQAFCIRHGFLAACMAIKIGLKTFGRIYWHLRGRHLGGHTRGSKTEKGGVLQPRLLPTYISP